MGASLTVGFDTSTADSVAAIADGERTVAETAIEGPSEGPPNHATELLPLIERIVGEHGGWEAVGTIAVGVGPGSYTGLRIGLATARGLAQGLGKELRPVSSLHALGLGIAEERPGRALLPLIDARRKEVFAMLIGAEGEV